jgi:hypothetical protein
MYIVYVKNFRKKIILFSFVLLFWICMFFLINLIMNNSLIYKITINKHITFLYPSKIQIGDIFINESFSNDLIEASLPLDTGQTKNFLDYESLKGKFSFKYPSIFTLNPKDFSGSEILYHIDFKSKSGDVHGFVQVWNMPYSLNDFLEKSKNSSTQNYKYFKSSSILVNGLPGYLWDYSLYGSDGKYYKGSEVFLKKDDKMYRISYFVPESLWSKSEYETFWSIVNSFKVH